MVQTKYEILKDFEKRMRRAYTMAGIVTILSFGEAIYETKFHEKHNEGFNAKSKNPIVTRYLDTKDHILPYLKFKLKSFNELDSFFVSNNLRQKLEGVEKLEGVKEEHLRGKRTLEEVLKITQDYNLELSRTNEVKEYYSLTSSKEKEHNNLFYAMFLSIFSFGGLSIYLYRRAINKKRDALKEIGEPVYL